MPLNLSAGGEDFTPYIKYNAKAGRFYIRPQGATADVEVEKPRLLFDMINIKTGWIYYPEGGSPEKVWDSNPQQAAPRPPGPKKFKRGFEVMVLGNDNLPGIGKLGLREFSSTASNSITAILKMHAAYETGLTANPGCVPFYRCTSVLPIAGAYGTNYEPVFELMAWVDRKKAPDFDAHLANADNEPARQVTNGTPPPAEKGDPGFAGGGGRSALDDEIPFSPVF